MVGYIEGIFENTLRTYWNKMTKGKEHNLNEISLQENIKLKSINRVNEDRRAGFTLVRALNHNFRVRETHYMFMIVAAWQNAIDLFLLLFMLFYLLNFIFLTILYCSRGKKAKEFYFDNRDTKLNSF